MSKYFATIDTKIYAPFRVYNRENGDIIFEGFNQDQEIDPVIEFIHENYGDDVKIYINDRQFLIHQLMDGNCFEITEEEELVFFPEKKFEIGEKLVYINLQDKCTIFESYEVLRPKNAVKINEFCINALINDRLTAFTDLDVILVALEIKPKEAYLVLPDDDGFVFENIAEKIGSHFINCFLTEWLDFEDYVLGFEFNPNLVILRGGNMTSMSRHGKIHNMRFIVDYKQPYVVPKPLQNYESKPNLMGIDFGTTHLCLAISRNNRIEPIPIDKSGDLWVPSAIYFDKEELIVGKAAINKLRNEPDSVIYCPKINPSIYYGKDYFGYSWGSNVQYSFGEPNYYVKEHETIKKFSLSEIVAFFMKTIQNAASEYQSELNCGKKVNNVVVTIPHWKTELTRNINYDHCWMEAIIAAGIDSEIEILDMIPEVYADFLYYLSKYDVKEGQNILVMDCGGSKTSCQAYQIVTQNDRKRIIHLDQIRYRSWDYKSIAMGGAQFEDKIHEKMLEILSETFDINPMKTNKTKHYFFQALQKIKCGLTHEDKVTVDLSDFDPQIENTEWHVTKEMLNDIFKEEIVEQYEQELEKWKKKHDFNVIFLAGGTNRVPILQEIIKKKFPNAELIMDGEVEIITATGAAIHGLQLLNGEIKPFTFFDRFSAVKEKSRVEVVRSDNPGPSSPNRIGVLQSSGEMENTKELLPEKN